jgi:hypothetical protein
MSFSCIGKGKPKGKPKHKKSDEKKNSEEKKGDSLGKPITKENSKRVEGKVKVMSMRNLMESKDKTAPEKRAVNRRRSSLTSAIVSRDTLLDPEKEREMLTKALGISQKQIETEVVIKMTVTKVKNSSGSTSSHCIRKWKAGS